MPRPGLPVGLRPDFHHPAEGREVEFPAFGEQRFQSLASVESLAHGGLDYELRHEGAQGFDQLEGLFVAAEAPVVHERVGLQYREQSGAFASSALQLAGAEHFRRVFREQGRNFHVQGLRFLPAPYQGHLALAAPDCRDELAGEVSAHPVLLPFRLHIDYGQPSGAFREPELREFSVHAVVGRLERR